ncbi:MAG: hypothetical protein A3G52_01810 [Candidatus Taylorbacteria bacterium RIFCSPLOWO2_12_FULL_43_20]|uniref:Uncharacterized protein n=1 Tax=Candidatus Taylorbacteria bacterium RIFCSPLOWO2_12_FULL_43_20 TaxID=1802332 RepID=A0A1G2P2S2_9BACT|nr:MAG: hypothetical protein A3B98_00295 [Candidatus Taylorbacteria bacterium RIFCSPHIGHO2_02_FULL_43_55]OHA29937.1 MAG: hypothetical protein A3E92_03925 [Candidatus Taylorbacteria bacterium RIFCSPHIGHO2_12_FULL_42_34]OHA30569.1 MAG: hypothetical protein A3B09_01545 [Candidatus Taylorbacteria bacterium RIFCSPLOWO2_01_FULL_43_83]OHA38401.1 MAG: hypothetical protein A3H58_04350 [Candidatus Taylorbacteria bacterium RIFCSPLOWO2_02_FULL_43_22b]OHA42009.1 MAG: hypothetical protein A3G52_01810 [Candid
MVQLLHHPEELEGEISCPPPSLDWKLVIGNWKLIILLPCLLVIIKNFEIILKIKIIKFKICEQATRKLPKLLFPPFVAFVFIPDASVGAPTEASESYIGICYY